MGRHGAVEVFPRRTVSLFLLLLGFYRGKENFLWSHSILLALHNSLRAKCCLFL